MDEQTNADLQLPRCSGGHLLLHDSLPGATQRLIDRRIEALLEDPTGDPHACYYRPHDEWSIPFAFGADERSIYYGIADEPRQVVILRRLVFGG